MIFKLCLYWILQSFIFYCCVYGQGDDGFQRYIVEDGFKPAIFGSYSYDPVRQVFEPHPKNKTSTAATVTVISTKIGDITGTVIDGSSHSPETPKDRLRQRVSLLAGRSTHTTHWWARAKPTQTTRWAYKNLTNLFKNML